MYAAAGGASLASRQARQRQRQQKKTLQLQAKLHPPKASVLSVAEHGSSTPTRQSRQFHQLPTDYLRAPRAQARKLSASYTAQSKLLLPIDEGDTQSVLQMHMHTHTHAHMHHSHSHSHAAGHHSASHPSHSHHQQQQPQHHHYHHGYGRVSPKLIHRHSGSSGTSFHYSHLPKSATATLPLVSQVEATPPMTPSGAVVATKASAAASSLATAPTPPSTTTTDHDAISVPHHDAIIVTPATPMASPGHVTKQQYQEQDQDQEQSSVDELPEAAAEKQPLTSAGAYDDGNEEPMEPPPGPLERKCSVYRMRRSDAFEHEKEFSGGGAGSAVGRQLRDLQFNNNQQQYEPLLTDSPQLVFKGLPNGRKWQPCAYCEEGICVCEHIECAQGRAAWLERGRRCSVQEAQEQAACHRRWVKRNRIQDASLGGSSDDEDFLGVLRGPSTFANAFLYVGLGTVALGLVIAFVGTGEKGFKTVELRLIGPSLIVLGLICCILRILFCICPSHCISSNKKTGKKNGNKVDADHTTSLLRGESKRVSIARGPVIQPKYPITHKRSNSKMLNEGMEALRQIATTSLFMQNEQKPSSMNRIVPIIKEPGNPIEAPLEMKKLETALNVCEISDEADEDDENTTRKPTTRSTTKENMTGTDVPTITAATITTTTNSAAQATNTTNISTAVSSERPSSLSSASKLSRQRIALNKHHQQHQQQQQQHQLLEQSQSLSSSSTVKDSVDDDLLMETSLMVIKASPTLITEACPPTTQQSSNSGSTLNRAAAVNSTGAIPRQTATSSPSATAIPPPPTYAGAISRLCSATQHTTTYDLPSATPHSYGMVVSGLTFSRSATERESLIRGPLGMPLSALTASSSTYAMAVNPPVSMANSAAITTTLLPLLEPTATLPSRSMTAAAMGVTSTYTIPCNRNHSSIPGQVFSEAKSSTSYAPAANASVRPNSAAATTTISDMATTSHSILMPSSSNEMSSPRPPLSIQLQQSRTTTATSAAQSVFAANTSFSFPAPLSSSSASSSASSNGRSMLTAATTATAPTTATTSFIGATLAPAPPFSNKFEPELLLSPAKLGQ